VLCYVIQDIRAHVLEKAVSVVKRREKNIYFGDSRAMVMRNDTRKIAALSSALILTAAVLTIVLRQGEQGSVHQSDVLLSPLQVGRYAVRAERQSGDYDQKAERQVAFATDNDNAATSERLLAAKEEKRARQSAYLAADIKSRIDKILEAGRDQVQKYSLQAIVKSRLEIEIVAICMGSPSTHRTVLIGCILRQVNQATKLKAKAGRLQEEGSQLLDKASAEKGKAAELKVG
jgi:hypothetical protein